jgi:hypothetical protein
LKYACELSELFGDWSAYLRRLAGRRLRRLQTLAPVIMYGAAGGILAILYALAIFLPLFTIWQNLADS